MKSPGSFAATVALHCAGADNRPGVGGLGVGFGGGGGVGGADGGGVGGAGLGGGGGAGVGVGAGGVGLGCAVAVTDGGTSCVPVIPLHPKRTKTNTAKTQTSQPRLTNIRGPRLSGGTHTEMRLKI